MRRKYSFWVPVVVLLMGVALLAAPRVSSAATINTVSAFSGGVIYTIWGGGLPDTINPGENLILIQNPPGNFDTSDNCGPGAAGPQTCAGIPAPTVTVNGEVFTDGSGGDGGPNVLGFNYTGGNPASNEAHEWALIGTSLAGDFQVYVGYADNSHTDACLDAGANCHPDGPWIGDPGVTTIGTLGTTFDTGAIRILALAPRVPEPATLLLLGAGLVGLVALGRRRGA